MTELRQLIERLKHGKHDQSTHGRRRGGGGGASGGASGGSKPMSDKPKFESEYDKLVRQSQELEQDAATHPSKNVARRLRSEAKRLSDEASKLEKQGATRASRANLDEADRLEREAKPIIDNAGNYSMAEIRNAMNKMDEAQRLRNPPYVSTIGEPMQTTNKHGKHDQSTHGRRRGGGGGGGGKPSRATIRANKLDEEVDRIIATSPDGMDGLSNQDKNRILRLQSEAANIRMTEIDKQRQLDAVRRYRKHMRDSEKRIAKAEMLERQVDAIRASNPELEGNDMNKVLELQREIADLRQWY